MNQVESGSIALNFIALGLAVVPILYLLAVAWPLARTDWFEHRLPNRYTLPALVVAAVGQTMASIVLGFAEINSGGSPWVAFSSQGVAILAAVIAFVLALSAHIWAGLGMGDVKLLTAITLSLAYFNPWSPMLAIGIGFCFAVLWVVIGLARRRLKLNAALPLGPALLAGFAVAALVLGVDLSGFYKPGEVIDNTSRALSS